MVILIRYGEIALKSAPVRRRMETVLARNVRTALAASSVPFTLRRGFGRLLVEAPDEALQPLRRVFGIISFSPAVACRAAMDEIVGLACELARRERFATFAVDAHRIGKHPFTSRDINVQVGEAIRQQLKATVNLRLPEKRFFIDVRDQTAYVFTEKIPGPGGMPVGTQGGVACALATERDLLAAWLFLRKGCIVTVVSPDRRLLAVLEGWAFRPLPVAGTMEEAASKGVLGIVAAEDSQSEPLKHLLLPVYTPLVGLDDGEVARLLDTVKS